MSAVGRQPPGGFGPALIAVADGTTWWIAVVAVMRQNTPMLHTRDLADTIEVDGLTYEWSVQREPQWRTADGWRGLVVFMQL